MEFGHFEDAEPADQSWERHKRLITTLYSSWSLEEVQRHLEEHHDFRASKNMFKRKLQKWGVGKNTTSDEMDRVIRTLMKTNRQDLTQPCPDKEMEVEGQKVRLSQVKRYMRRNNISVASQDDTNEEFHTRTQDNLPAPSFTSGSAPYDFDRRPLSVDALIESLSLYLCHEDIVDLTREIRSFSDADLYALAAGRRRYPVSLPDSPRSSLASTFSRSSTSSNVSACSAKGLSHPKPRYDPEQQLFDDCTTIEPIFKTTPDGLAASDPSPSILASNARGFYEIARKTLGGQSERPSWSLSNSVPHWPVHDRRPAFESTLERERSNPQDQHSHGGLSNAAEYLQRPSGEKRSLRMVEADEDQRSYWSSSKQRRFADTTGPGFENRLFACPFAKFDPVKFSEKNVKEKKFRCCKTFSAPNISRLKQHLYRVHSRPEFYCGRCFSIFKSEDALGYHLRSEVICKNSETKPEDLFSGTMSLHQMSSIKKKRFGEDGVQTWFSIYKTLFPSATLPLSPFAEGEIPDSTAELFANFRRRGPTLLSQKIREGLVPRLALDKSEQGILDDILNNVVCEAVETMLIYHELNQSQTHANTQQSVNDYQQSEIRMPGPLGMSPRNFSYDSEIYHSIDPSETTATSTATSVDGEPAPHPLDSYQISKDRFSTYLLNPVVGYDHLHLPPPTNYDGSQNGQRDSRVKQSIDNLIVRLSATKSPPIHTTTEPLLPGDYPLFKSPHAKKAGDGAPNDGNGLIYSFDDYDWMSTAHVYEYSPPNQSYS